MKKNKDLMMLITFDKELEELQEIKRTTLEGIRGRHKEISARIEKIEEESKDLILEANKVSEENKKKVERIDSLLDLI